MILNPLELSPSTSGTRRIRLFYSYAREDIRYVTRLQKQLKTLVRSGALTTRHDRQIGPGKK